MSGHDHESTGDANYIESAIIGDDEDDLNNNGGFHDDDDREQQHIDPSRSTNHGNRNDQNARNNSNQHQPHVQQPEHQIGVADDVSDKLLEIAQVFSSSGYHAAASGAVGFVEGLKYFMKHKQNMNN